MDSRHLRAFFEANRVVVSTSDTGHIPVSVVVTFLGVALWEDEVDDEGEPLTLEGLAARVGMTATTISQHLRYLGDWYRQGKPGLQLVETEVYEHNRRKKVFRLTPRGRGLARQLELVIRKLS